MAILCVVSDLDTIGKEISRVWRADGPAGKLRVRCRFEMKVEHPDEALDDRYFPNTNTTGGPTARPRPTVAPHAAWIEDVAVRGDRYRNDHEFLAVEGRAPGPLELQRFFDGKDSWSHDPYKGAAERYAGPHPATRLTLGYYQDMIGFPLEPLARTRTTAGDIGEPYRLDSLFHSGKYAIEGEAAVEGEDCVVVSRLGLDRLWLARDRGWAVVRREWAWTVGGPLKRRIVNRDFREIASGAWIPYTSRMEVHGHPATRPGTRVGTLEARVLVASADICPEWFEPHFPEGTQVVDLAAGPVHLPVAELLSPSADVAEVSDLGRGPHPTDWWQRPATLCGGTFFLAGALIVGLRVVRGCKARPAHPGR